MKSLVIIDGSIDKFITTRRLARFCAAINGKLTNLFLRPNHLDKPGQVHLNGGMSCSFRERHGSFIASGCASSIGKCLSPARDNQAGRRARLQFQDLIRAGTGDKSNGIVDSYFPMELLDASNDLLFALSLFGRGSTAKQGRARRLGRCCGRPHDWHVNVLLLEQDARIVGLKSEHKSLLFVVDPATDRVQLFWIQAQTFQGIHFGCNGRVGEELGKGKLVIVLVVLVLRQARMARIVEDRLELSQRLVD